MKTRARPPLIFVAAVFVVFGMLLTVFAASLGTFTPQKLFAVTDVAGTSAPTVYGWDNFTAPGGTNLNGRTSPSGKVWTVDGGTWTINANVASSTNTTLANVWMNAGVVDAAVEGTLSGIAGGTKAGFTLNDAGTTALYFLYRRAAGGTITLLKYQGGAVTLATFTGVGSVASATFRAESTSANVFNVYINGVLKATYTLTPAEVTALKTPGATHFGMMADADSALTKFDNFRVESTT